MTWDGRGLPPVAAERVRRAAAGGPWTSLLSAPAAAGLSSTEFEPVGEVMGSIVQRIGWSGGYMACGALNSGFLGGWSAPPEPVLAFKPYVQAMYHGYDTALRRLRDEATALGADGVVGIALTMTHLVQGTREFTALGTAVRSRRRSPEKRAPFTTDLPGTDVAKLAASGWRAARLVYGITVALAHDDWRTRNQSSWGAGNVEVEGPTRLVTFARAEARRRFGQRVTKAGGQGAIVSSMGVSMSRIEPSDNHTDHVAEATVFGNALAAEARPSGAPERSSSLTFLPLR